MPDQPLPPGVQLPPGATFTGVNGASPFASPPPPGSSSAGLPGLPGLSLPPGAKFTGVQPGGPSSEKEGTSASIGQTPLSQPDEDGSYPGESISSKLWRYANTPLVSEKGFNDLVGIDNGPATSVLGGVGKSIEHFAFGLTSPLTLGLTLATLPLGGEGGLIESAGSTALRGLLVGGTEGLDAAAIAAKTADAAAEIKQFGQATRNAIEAERLGKSIPAAVRAAGMDNARYNALHVMLQEAKLAPSDFVGVSSLTRMGSAGFRALGMEPHVAQNVTKGLEVLMNLGFTVQMGAVALHSIGPALDDLKDGNYSAAAEKTTEGLLSLGFGALGAHHFLTKAGEFLPAINEAQTLRPTEETAKVRGAVGDWFAENQAASNDGRRVEDELNAEYDKPQYQGNLFTSLGKSFASIWESKDTAAKREGLKDIALAVLDTGPERSELARQMANAYNEALGRPELTIPPRPKEGPSVIPARVGEGPPRGPDMLPGDTDTVASNVGRLEREGQAVFTGETRTAAMQPEAGGAMVPQAEGAQPFSDGGGLHPLMPENIGELIEKMKTLPEESRVVMRRFADAYAAVANGVPTELLGLHEQMRNHENNTWLQASSAEVLRSYLEDHIQHIWNGRASEATGVLYNEIRSGKFDLNANQAKQRVFRSFLEGIANGYLPIMDPVQLIGYNIENLRTIGANVKLYDTLHAQGFRASDGLPVMIFKGQGEAMSARNGGDPGVIVNPNSIRDIRIAAREIAALRQSGMLERHLTNGNILDITPHVTVATAAEWVPRYEKDIAAFEEKNAALLDQPYSKQLNDKTHEFIVNYAHNIAEAVQKAIDGTAPLPEVGLNLPEWVHKLSEKPSLNTTDKSLLENYVRQMRNHAQGLSRDGSKEITNAQIADLLRQARGFTQITLRDAAGNPVEGGTIYSTNYRNAESPAIEEHVNAAREIDKQLQLPPGKYTTGDGLYEGGHEPTLITRMDGTVDRAVLRKAAADRGRIVGSDGKPQDSVLAWHNDDAGPNVRYTIHLDGIDSARATAAARAAGLDYATVEKTDDGSLLHVIDIATDPNEQKALKEKINEHFTARGHHTETSRGTGELIWNREKAPSSGGDAATYDSVEGDYQHWAHDVSRQSRAGGHDLLPDTEDRDPRELQRDAFAVGRDKVGQGLHSGEGSNQAKAPQGSSWTYSRGIRPDGRGSRVLGVPTLESWSLDPEKQAKLRAEGFNSPDISELDYRDPKAAQVFHDAIQRLKEGNKYAAAVHVYDPNEYTKMRLFLSDDGKAGFALKPDGDIVSVFAHGAENKGASGTLLEIAKQAGGSKLDAFDTVLPEIYGQHGFKAISRLSWNDEHAPAGWDKKTFAKHNGGEPDVVFMALDKDARGYQAGDGQKVDDYDQAVRLQGEHEDPSLLSQTIGRVDLPSAGGGSNQWANLNKQITQLEKEVASRTRELSKASEADKPARQAALDQSQKDLVTAQEKMKNLPSDSRIGEIREDSTGRRTLWLSGDAMKMIHIAETPADRRWMIAGSDLRGQSFEKPHLAGILSEIRKVFANDPQYGPQVEPLLKVLNQAIDVSGKEGITIVGAKGGGINQTIRTAREEMNHAWQRTMSSQGDINSHLPSHVINRLHRLIPQGMMDYLRRHRYVFPIPQGERMIQTIETAAKLMGSFDPQAEYGVSPQHAEAFMREYFHEVTDRHGDGAFDTLQHVVGVTKKLKEEMSNGRIPYKRPNQRTPGSIPSGPEGRRPPSAGPYEGEEGPGGGRPEGPEVAPRPPRPRPNLLPPDLDDGWNRQFYKDRRGNYIMGGDSLDQRHIAMVKDAASNTEYAALKAHLQILKGVMSGGLDKSALKPINDAQEERYVWHPQGYVTPEKQLSGIKWLTKGPNGDNVFVNGEAAFHPEFAPYLVNALGLDTSVLRKNEGLGRITGPALTSGKELKSLLLTGSPFHMMQLALRGLMVGINPFVVHPVDSFGLDSIKTQNDALYQARQAVRDNPGKPELQQEVEKLQHGVDNAWKLRRMAAEGATFTMDRRAVAQHSEGLASHSKLLTKIPILGKSMDWYQDFLFNRYMPSLKADAGVKMYDEYAKAHPDWNHTAVAKAAAEHINNTFGGQNWRAMGRAAATQDWFSLLALAPDWLESEMRFGASIFRGGLGDRNFSREQVLKMAAGMWGVARMLNLLYSGHPHLEAPFGLATKDKDGREVIYSMRTMPTDILHMASDPVNFLKGRMSPLARTSQEALSGHDIYGRKVPDGSAWIDLASNMAPIPLQAVGKAINGETPQVGNTGQLVKAMGGTANVYQTEAQKLAGQISSERNEEGAAMTEQQVRKSRAISRFEDDLRSGRMTFSQLDDLKDFSDLSRDEHKRIRDNIKMTTGLDPQTARLVWHVSRMQMADALQVYDQATPNERTAMSKMFHQKMTKYISSAHTKLTPGERQTDPTFLRVRKLVQMPIAEESAPAATTRPSQAEPKAPQASQAPSYDTGPLAGKPVAGMIQQGNVDVNHRPSITNADGSKSSIFSMTVPIGKDGEPEPWGSPKIAAYALVPSIVNGRFLSGDGKMPTDENGKRALEDAATRYYGQTRQQLGVFKTEEAANRYANQTHAYGNDGTSRTVYTPSY